MSKISTLIYVLSNWGRKFRILHLILYGVKYSTFFLDVLKGCKYFSIASVWVLYISENVCPVLVAKMFFTQTAAADRTSILKVMKAFFYNSTTTLIQKYPKPTIHSYCVEYSLYTYHWSIKELFMRVNITNTHWSFLSSNRSHVLELGPFLLGCNAMVEKFIGPISPKQLPTASANININIIKVAFAYLKPKRSQYARRTTFCRTWGKKLHRA